MVNVLQKLSEIINVNIKYSEQRAGYKHGEYNSCKFSIMCDNTGLSKKKERKFRSLLILAFFLLLILIIAS